MSVEERGLRCAFHYTSAIKSSLRFRLCVTNDSILGNSWRLPLGGGRRLTPDVLAPFPIVTAADAWEASGEANSCFGWPLFSISAKLLYS